MSVPGRIASVLGCVILLAGCGTAASPVPSTPGGPGAASTFPALDPPPIDLAGVPATVHVEEPRATSSWVGPAGGTLSATAEDGTAYLLEIPQNAVPEPTPITMTPVSEVDELGLSGGLAGAVFLQPAGLQLAVPATLRITAGGSAPAGTRLVGFDVPDDGARPELIPAVTSGPEISVLVFHFSAPGAAYGTTADLAQVSQTAIPTRLGALLTMLLAAPVPWDLNTRNAFGLLIDFQWAGSPVATQGPSVGLRQAIVDTASDAGLLETVKDWRTFVFVLNLWASSGAVAAALAAGESYAGGVRSFHTAAYLDGQIQLAIQFKRAIEGNEALCNQSHDLKALANMWFWAGIGARYAPSEADWPAAARGCAELVVATFNPASNLEAGGADSLQLVFNLEFEDGTRVPADVEAALIGAGFTFVSSGGTTMAAAVPAGTTFTTSAIATQPPPYTLTVTPCWYLDGLARNLCSGPYSLPFGAAATPTPAPQASGPSSQLPDLTGSYVINGRSSNAQQCGNVVSFRGAATAVQSGATVTVTWTFDALTTPEMDSCLEREWDQVVKSGSFTGTLVGDRTVGYRITGIPLSCGGPVGGGATTVGLSPRLSIVIPSDCGLNVFARADFVGP